MRISYVRHLPFKEQRLIHPLQTLGVIRLLIQSGCVPLMHSEGDGAQQGGLSWMVSAKTFRYGK